MKKKKNYTSIGGQALIEGIMMKGGVYTSIAVRKPDQGVHRELIKTPNIRKEGSIWSLPFLRGLASLYESLKIGSRALEVSSSFYMEDEEESYLEKKLGDKGKELDEAFTFIISLALALGLFIFLPNSLASIFRSRLSSVFFLNLIEGLVRIGIFLAYILIISRMEDMKRVFMYHGAEHKTIACYEAGEDLTVENVRKHSRLHPRCGTSFIMTVLIVSIFVMSFFGWPNPLVRTLIRIGMIPIIFGISYEINQALAKMNNWLTNIFTAPGLFMQLIGTVREPDDSMIEIAIEAMKLVIPENEKEADYFFKNQEKGDMEEGENISEIQGA